LLRTNEHIGETPDHVAVPGPGPEGITGGEQTTALGELAALNIIAR
jgi:hypothetical protein